MTHLQISFAALALAISMIPLALLVFVIGSALERRARGVMGGASQQQEGDEK